SPVGCTISLLTKSGSAGLTANVVNFQNNRGFVVTTTRENGAEDLIAVSNNGNLDTVILKDVILNPIDLPIYDDSLSGLSWGDVLPDDDEDDPDDLPYTDIDPYYSVLTSTPFLTDDYVISSLAVPSGEKSPIFVEVMIGDMIRNDARILEFVDEKDTWVGDNGERYFPEWSDWTFHCGVPTLLRTKWRQGSPYNDHCPVIDGRVAPAGCVAIATGQLAAYFRRPVYENWDVMSSFGVYVGPNFNEPEPYKPIIAAYIRSLGEELDMDYGADGSSSSINKAKRYVKNEMGFSDVRKNKWKWERVQDRLNHGMPVYTRGSRGLSGHAWVVDGYITLTRRDLNGRFPDGYKTVMHINWGWGGWRDGYFFVGIFSPAEEPEFRDIGSGDHSGTDYTMGAYTTEIKTLTWSYR
ncbi:MAG: hypothetical protein E7117_04560, partial [Bacteroidales bacterium]|nr:hypothetical protein [Bacteroidales bacterium]